MEPRAKAREELAPQRLHYRPAEGWFGDAHPIFWRGKWWVYYLQVPREPFRSALADLTSEVAVSEDLVHWEQVPLSIDDSSRDWWAIAVIENSSGTLSAAYNGGKGFDLAHSEDGVTWRVDPRSPVLPYAAFSTDTQLLERRDPNLFYDADTQTYHMTLAAKRVGPPVGMFGLLYQTQAPNLYDWSAPEVLYDPGNIGVPECPEVFKLNGRHYLLGNWGVDQVGQARWRRGDSPAGPWHAPLLDALDGSEVQAPNSGSDGQRRLMFGWVPTYRGNDDEGRAEWGGDMAFPREIWSDAEGQLYLRPIEELTGLRETTYEATPEDWAIQRGEFHKAGKGATTPAGGDYAEAWLPRVEDYYEIELEFTAGEDCPEVGVAIERAAQGNFPGYAVAVNFERNTLELKQHLHPRKTRTVSAFDLKRGERAHLRVIVDGDVVEAFLNDRWAIAGRIHQAAPDGRAAVYVKRGGCAIEAVRTHRLRPIAAQAEPRAELELKPAADPAREATGDSVLFARGSANVYMPHDPVLDFADAFTLECRVRSTPGADHRKMNLITKGDGNLPGYLWGLNLMKQHGVEVYVRTGAGDNFRALSSPPGTAPAAGAWGHVAAVIEPSAGWIRLYVDGRLVAEEQGDPFKAMNTEPGALRLGLAAGLPHSNQLFGLMDDVRIWGRALSPAEIEACAANPPKVDREDPALVIDWDFNHFESQIERGVPRVYVPNRAPRHAGLRAGLFDGAEVHAENAY